MPVDWPLATGDEGEVPLTLLLLLIVLVLLDVNGMMPAKPGKWERIAKTNALAPTTITITPIVQRSITFVMSLVVDFEAAPVVCALW